MKLRPILRAEFLGAVHRGAVHAQLIHAETTSRHIEMTAGRFDFMPAPSLGEAEIYNH